MKTVAALHSGHFRPVAAALVMCLWVLAWIPGARCDDVRLTARVDRNHVTVYDRIQYTLTVETNRRNTPDPVPPDFSGFKVLGPPRTSTQFSWVNGRTTSTKVYTYILQAQKEGQFTISPAQIRDSGRTVQSTPVRIIVDKPGS
ncbi:MAG TPA: BatD family protein, partial [bacterium]|nr:BatD family protein [bacterium]